MISKLPNDSFVYYPLGNKTLKKINVFIFNVILFFLDYKTIVTLLWASLVAQKVKNLLAILARDPGLGRSPIEGKGYPVQYSCLENPWAEEPGRLQSTGAKRFVYD